MKPHLWYWLVAGLLLFWGLSYGGLVLFSFLLATPEHWSNLVAEGAIKQEYAEYIARIPTWVKIITVLAAITRLAGAIALCLGKAWAYASYAISLIFVCVIMFRGFVLEDVAQVIRGSQVVLEMVFLMISLFAVWWAKRQIKAGILT